jgi:hypothetical protein
MTYPQDSFTDDSESLLHHRLAAEVFDLYFDQTLPVQADRNVLSLASAEVCFAQRLDCRTYFVEHQQYGHDRPAGVFQGPDEKQFAFSRALLQRLGISDEEIAKEEVLHEFGQAAQIDPHTQQVIKLEPAREIRNFLHVIRQVKGMPVWSSHLKMGLTVEGKIGFLELHWPIIPDAVTREAQRLTFKVRNGWKAPAITSAEVESVEVGIIHTPAVGYFFDIHAAVRVIYKSLHPNIGRKPMYHLDRHGEPVLLRRTSELISEPTMDTRTRKGRTSLCRVLLDKICYRLAKVKRRLL